MTASVATVAHPGPFAANPVLTKGEGRPVVFLHGAFAQQPVDIDWPRLAVAPRAEDRLGDEREIAWEMRRRSHGR